MNLFEKINQLEINLKINITTEIICVDDGSTDNSFQQLYQVKKIKKNLKVIKFKKNYGSTTALLYGMKFVSGDVVTFLAADLQDHPNVILKMAKKWIDGNELIISQRSSRKDPIISKVLSNLYYIFVNKFINKKFPQTGSDMFLLDKKYFGYLLDSVYKTNIPLLVFSTTKKYKLLQSHRHKRVFGKSQWSFKKIKFIL